MTNVDAPEPTATWPWLRLAIAVALLGVAFAPLSLIRGEIAIDDVYITYRYAQNLAQGEGLVFNPGERIFGTTAPGMAILLAVLHRSIGMGIPLLGNLLTCLAAGVLAITLTASRRPDTGRLAAWLGALLFALSPQLWVFVGSEYPVTLALVAAAAFVGARRPALAGAIAGFAAWCRPDAVLAIGALGFLLWRRKRGFPWTYTMAAASTVATGLLLAFWWFGQALPSTLQAKRVQAGLGASYWASGWAFWDNGYRAIQEFTAGPATLPFVVLGLCGAALLVRKGSTCERTLVLYALGVSLAYPFLGVPFYTWYATPLILVLCAGFAAAAVAILLAVVRFFAGSRLAWVLALAVVALLAGPTVGTICLRSVGAVRNLGSDPRFESYRAAGLWLQGHARPGDRVAYVEIGTLAYFSRLPVADLLGLVTPESLPFLAAKDIEGAFLRAPTSLVLSTAGLSTFMKGILEAEYFAPNYVLAATVEAEPGGPQVRVYRRLETARLPPARPPLALGSPPAGRRP